MGYHVLTLSSSIYFDYWTLTEQKPLWEQFCYLTNITQTLIAVYYLLALIQDLKGSNSYSKSLVNFYRIISALSFIVFLTYWGLRTVKKELVIKPGSNPPIALSIYTHGINTFILYLENIFLSFPRYITKLRALTIYLGIVLFYVALMNIHTYFTGSYIYGFLKEFGLIGNILFYAGVYVLVLLVDLIYSTLLMTSLIDIKKEVKISKSEGKTKKSEKKGKKSKKD